MPATPTPTPRIRVLRRFTIRAINPVTRLVAGWLPGFGILSYAGRTTGRRYRTPINVFRDDGRYVFALTYGADVQWVRNVVAAAGCELRTRGRNVRLVEPELIVDPARTLVPAAVRAFLGLLRVTEFLRMRRG